MSSLFRSTIIKGNRLTDFAQSTATVGIVIPFGYGTFPCDGNVIWAPLPPKEHRSVKRQGKGGVKQETFTYTLSYAVGFALGPIAGYQWIKRNGKVVYTTDPNAPIEDQAYAAKWLQKATLYYGLRSQLPDSTIESYEGSGQVSAFRDLAYIVVEDDDVTEGGGAVPTYEACVIASPPDIYVTSLPYPVYNAEGVALDISPVGGQLRTILHERFVPDSVEMQVAAYTGELRDVYIRRYIQEAAQFSIAAAGGSLKSAQQNAEAESSAVGFSIAATGGRLKNGLITATEQKSAVQMTIAPVGGSLQ